MLVRLVPKNSRHPLDLAPQNVQLIPYPWVMWLKDPVLLDSLTSPAVALRVTSPCISRPLRGIRCLWHVPWTPWFITFSIHVSFCVASPAAPMDTVTACWETLLLTSHIVLPSGITRSEALLLTFMAPPSYPMAVS